MWVDRAIIDSKCVKRPVVETIVSNQGHGHDDVAIVIIEVHSTLFSRILMHNGARGVGVHKVWLVVDSIIKAFHREIPHSSMYAIYAVAVPDSCFNATPMGMGVMSTFVRRRSSSVTETFAPEFWLPFCSSNGISLMPLHKSRHDDTVIGQEAERRY